MSRSELTPEAVLDVDIPPTSTAHISDCIELYQAYEGATPSDDELLAFASMRLDFRKGKSREETCWEKGTPLSSDQKEATLDLAKKWGMLQTTYPDEPFTNLVVLGAHKASLELRMKHASNIFEEQAPADAALILLNCYRPLSAQEGLEENDTEYDLAINLAEKEFGGKFEADSFSCWEDLAHDTDQYSEEYAVAALGRLCTIDTMVISGSRPENSNRATTASTLMSLQSLLETSEPELLFVTTSLHLPYQRAQIQKILPDFKCGIVGVEYDNLSSITAESEDYKFRLILQEIGATIKNILSSAHDMETRPAASM